MSEREVYVGTLFVEPASGNGRSGGGGRSGGSGRSGGGGGGGSRSSSASSGGGWAYSDSGASGSSNPFTKKSGKEYEARYGFKSDYHLGLAYGHKVYDSDFKESVQAIKDAFDRDEGRLIPFKSTVRAGAGASSITAASMGQTLVGSVQIGTPPTTANVMFDTGSPTFWVSSSLCRQGNGCPTSAGNPYNPSTSRTAKIATNSSSLTRQYGDGTSVDCVIVQDSLTIAGITIPDQNICAATSIVYPQVTQEDGLVGLAPPQVSDPADVFGNLKSAFSESKVSFWYDRNVNSLDANSGIVPNAGEITFGTPASSRYTGDFAWLPIIRTASHWSVTLNSVTVNGVTTNAKTTQSLMDTGTSLIYLSPEIFKAVNGPMGGVLASDSIYQVDCTKVRSFPDITFTFNGAPLTLTWDQQIIILQKKYCISVFSTSTDLPPIFGASFLRNFYTTFDYSGRIGFAKPTGDVTPLNVPTQSGLSGTGQNAASPSRILSPLLVAAVAAVTFASWL